MHPTLPKINEINSQIEMASHSNLWDKVSNLAVQRHELIKSFFQSNPTTKDLQVFEGIAENISSIDKAVTQQINKTKKQSVSEGLNLKHAHNAVKQYSQDYDVT